MSDWVKRKAENQRRQTQEDSVALDVRLFWRQLREAFQRDATSICEEFGHHLKIRVSENRLYAEKPSFPYVEVIGMLDIPERVILVERLSRQYKGAEPEICDDRLSFDWDSGNNLCVKHAGVRMESEEVSEFLLTPFADL